MTEQDEADAFEQMFMEKQERLDHEKSKITNALKALNKRRAEKAKANG